MLSRRRQRSRHAGKLYTHNHHYHANWMKHLGDHIQLEHINIPGTHDAAACMLCQSQVLPKFMIWRC